MIFFRSKSRHDPSTTFEKNFRKFTKTKSDRIVENLVSKSKISKEFCENLFDTSWQKNRTIVKGL